MMTLPVWQEVPHDQLNHPFLVPPGVVGVVAPDGGVLASLLSDLISCKSLSFVSFCIFSSYSLTSLIVISYQSSILDLEMKKYDDFTKKKLFNFSVKSIHEKQHKILCVLRSIKISSWITYQATACLCPSKRISRITWKRFKKSQIFVKIIFKSIFVSR